jgi:hypothetical protein
VVIAVGILENKLAGFAVSVVMGARDSAVVKALCYKPEGRGFET